MNREEAIEILSSRDNHGMPCGYTSGVTEALDMAIEALKMQENMIPLDGEDIMFVTAEEYEGIKAQEWIPCSERLPNELESVNVTWVNHNPPVYYQHIKDVPKADTAVYYKGAWYWWDATLIDLLGEYDGAYVHGIEPIDKDIEVIAWMPLPPAYEGE